MEDSLQPISGAQNPLNQYPCIPLPEAQSRVRNWLNAITRIPYFEQNQEQIPRAIFISHDDLQALKEKYPDTMGIRVYFGIDQPITTQASTEDPYQVTGLVVPVLKNEAGNYEDIIRRKDEGEEKTAVYDFTRPCPVFCDMNSELYVKLDGAQH